MSIKPIYIIILFCFVSAILNGQTRYSKKFTVKNGLAQSQVFSLYQDNKGFLWVGTVGGGVNIYDGKSFRILTTDDGLAGDMVFAIVPDSKGNIWLGTNDGVSKYNGKVFKNYTVDDGLPDKYIWCIKERNDGSILIGTSKGVAILANEKIILVDNNEQLKNSIVYSIFEDKDETLWFGTNGNGVFRYYNSEIVQFVTTIGKYNNTVRTINQDKDGNIWFGTDNGLNIFADDSLITIRDNGTFLYSFLTKKNDLWLSNYGGHIMKVSLSDRKLSVDESINIKIDKVRTFMFDIEGNIWVGAEEGLVQVPPFSFVNISVNDSLIDNNVFSICEEKNGVFWVGCNGKGVSRFFFNKGAVSGVKNYYYKDLNSIASSKVFSIIKDFNQNIWFGTWGGISIYNPYTDSFDNVTCDSTAKSYNPNLTSPIVNSLIIDSKKRIWVGTKNGVTQYYDSTFYNFNNKYPVLKDKEILNIYEDKQRNIWFTSKSGIYKYTGKEIKYYGSENGFIDDIVNAIVQDDYNNYWIATKKGVYNLYQDNFILLNKDSGLSSNNIYLIGLGDNNELYIGTDKGFDVLNTKEYNQTGMAKFKHYGNIEGFIGQECNRNAFFKDSKGKIWFGTIEGVTMFDPQNDQTNMSLPNTYITDINLDFKEFDWSPYCKSIDQNTNLPIELVLPYNKNHLTFQFIATSLTIPEKTKYKYILEGLNEDWSPALSKTEADYPALPPGDYIFKVKACNNDGIWNENPISFKFTINPPFWKTTWFLIISLFFILLIIYFFIKWREASLKKEKRILEERVAERTTEIVRQKEIVEQKNKDITDSINYAKNIQEAILPTIKEFESIFKSSFILYQPRDIVSGDFYWMTHKDDKTFFAVSDCTGHGVPGAFMSMLGIAFLDEIVSLNPNVNASSILNQLRDNVITSLHQTGGEGESKDGMDLALCILDWKKREIQFAGANNPLYILRDGNIIEYKPDKMPIGFHFKNNNFRNNVIEIQNHDKLYLFSDGFADQFGGPNNKKFKYKQFKELLLNVQTKTMNEQKTIIQTVLKDWQGKNEQLDDILVVGIQLDFND